MGSTEIWKLHNSSMWKLVFCNSTGEKILFEKHNQTHIPQKGNGILMPKLFDDNVRVVASEPILDYDNHVAMIRLI